VEWPKLPKAFFPDPWKRFGNNREVQYPQRRALRKDNEEPCEMFHARANENKSAQMTLAALNADMGVD
jgi:hypothetical protein